MITFAEKVFNARVQSGLTQEQLGERIGVSRKSVAKYELGISKPHNSTLIKLAKALNVSIKYLSDDSCENEQEGIEKDSYIEETHRKYGAAGVRDMQSLLAENTALFAGGDLSPEEMDKYYQAITAIYEVCRAEASKKFGRKPQADE